MTGTLKSTSYKNLNLSPTGSSTHTYAQFKHPMPPSSCRWLGHNKNVLWLLFLYRKPCLVWVKANRKSQKLSPLCLEIQKYQESISICFRWKCILSGATVFDLITVHAPVSKQSSNLVVFRLQPVYMYFYLLLIKNICCGYSFELPQQIKTIQTSTHNICFYKENQKIISHKYH